MSKRLVVALSGGVGGAKLALGLSRVLPADELLVVANTGDDFEHLGLSISPDIDTLTYALAGIEHRRQRLRWHAAQDPRVINRPSRALHTAAARNGAAPRSDGRGGRLHH